MTCPYCHSTITNGDSLLGVLGSLKHYRCRYCGGQFSKTSRSKTFREVGSLCLAPIALAGYLFASEVTTQTSKDTDDKVGSGAVAQLLTCDKGWGAGLKASNVGLYAVDLHYGLKYETGPWSASLMPRAGLSYTSQTIKELPQDVQFSVGAQALLGYESFVVSAELWHLSNAGMTQPNIGLNMVTVTAGWRF